MRWRTTEPPAWDSAGRHHTPAPSPYPSPTSSDVPKDFRVTLYESGGNREDAIYLSKAVGEPPLMLAISVFSAITDAIASLKPAVMPRLDAPATPEAIMRAIRATTGGDM
jgi:xanthine dehydrogenase large subunit